MYFGGPTNGVVSYWVAYRCKLCVGWLWIGSLGAPILKRFETCIPLATFEALTKSLGLLLSLYREFGMKFAKVLGRCGQD